LYLSAAAESQTVRTTISLRLCALARRKIRRGGLAKTPSRKEPVRGEQALDEEKNLIPSPQKSDTE
jgi:hypothetical protein